MLSPTLPMHDDDRPNISSASGRHGANLGLITSSQSQPDETVTSRQARARHTERCCQRLHILDSDVLLCYSQLLSRHVHFPHRSAATRHGTFPPPIPDTSSRACPGRERGCLHELPPRTSVLQAGGLLRTQEDRFKKLLKKILGKS